ncbi:MULTISPECIES: hypothetical protein [Nostocaceae]|nr:MULTISPECIES: hypothetical protein [Nostocaceae]
MNKSRMLLYINVTGDGEDWGLGIGDWGLGTGDWVNFSSLTPLNP